MITTLNSRRNKECENEMGTKEDTEDPVLEPEFGDDVVNVFKCLHNFHHTNYVHSRSNYAVKIRLMTDNTMSLSFLQKAFPSAKGLFAVITPTEYELLPIKGDRICPKKEGWKSVTSYCIASSDMNKHPYSVWTSILYGKSTESDILL